MQRGRGRADVAEALNDDARFVAAHAEFRQRLVAGDHQAAAGGCVASLRAAHLDGLAGDDSGRGAAHVHGVGVHDPGHGLLVGAEVGRGNVALGPKPLAQFGGVAARDAFEFASGELRGIADDAALGAAEGNVHHRAFPGHLAGQRAHFVQRHIGRETDAALARPAHQRMMHAITDEDFQPPVIERHGNVDGDLLVGIAHEAVNAVFETQLFGGDFKARFGRMRRRSFHRGATGRMWPLDASPRSQSDSPASPGVSRKNL